MGKECGRSLGMEGQKKKKEEFELNLELSIGCYGKTEEEEEEEDSGKGEIRNLLFQENNNNISTRSNFSSENNVDPHRRREIHALRRQEARRKREEKIKKSKGQNGLLFVEDRLFLEAQKLQARVEERESRERDCVLGRKNCSNNEVGGGELSLSLFTDNSICSLYPKVQQQPPRAYSSADCDSEQSNGVNDPGNTTSNRSLEQCSSAVSDYQKGGSSSDTGSHSSPLRPHLYPGISRNLESHDSWSQAETDQVLRAPKVRALSNPPSNLRSPSTILKSESSLDQTNTSSRSENLSRETSGSLNVKSPTPAPNGNHHNAAVSIPKMPCVSTTGNGPNGRTVMGFLYKYTKTEVSIMCVCHERSFSPAEFVEHAGGVDISQPLKHITIVPS